MPGHRRDNRGMDVVVNDRITIPEAELELRFSTSGGPGGQHANRSSTRVELTFRLAESPSIPDDLRHVLVERLGDVVTLTVDESRSQWRNRQIAKRRLAERLHAALIVQRERRPTQPGRSARRRRLAAKRRRSEVKRMRRRPEVDD